MFEDHHIVLASSSPRRRELLRLAEIAFSVRVNAVPEVYPPEMPGEQVPEYLAGKKALAAQTQAHPEEMILAADTMILLHGTVIGKPVDEADARDILRRLSGKMHQVITGVCILKGTQRVLFSETTRVHFRELSEHQIDHYVATYRPLDKAGAYAIQEWIGLIGIEKIEGDYFNVVGLPVGKIIEKIKRLDD